MEQPYSLPCSPTGHASLENTVRGDSAASHDALRSNLLPFFICYAPHRLIEIPELVHSYLAEQLSVRAVVARCRNEFGLQPVDREVQLCLQKDTRTRLYCFYAYYDWNRIEQVDEVARTYRHVEVDLWKALESKYGPEHPPHELFKGDTPAEERHREMLRVRQENAALNRTQTGPQFDTSAYSPDATMRLGNTQTLLMMPRPEELLAEDSEPPTPAAPRRTTTDTAKPRVVDGASTSRGPVPAAAVDAPPAVPVQQDYGWHGRSSGGRLDEPLLHLPEPSGSTRAPRSTMKGEMPLPPEASRRLLADVPEEAIKRWAAPPPNRRTAEAAPIVDTSDFALL